jgi:hypothetical protein
MGETYLEDAVGVKTLALLSAPWNSINHVADVFQVIVKFSQILSSFGLVADLEELDTDLPGLSIALVEPLSRADDYRFDIIWRDTVGDDDDVEGFHLLDGRCELVSWDAAGGLATNDWSILDRELLK